ncbi:nuclease [Halomonas litopenaei]|nr:nuclease [Halomonas litopenaei]
MIDVRHRLRYVIVVSMALLTTEAMAMSYQGEVTHVSDGDTVRVSVTSTCPLASCPNRGESLTVRLAEIDAPESNQPYGNRAATAINERLAGSTVEVVQSDVDHYGRVVGQIIQDGVWVNGWMVGQGHAWVYRRYSDSPELIEWENAAREAGRGLWATAAPIAPWEWRRR